MPAERNPPAASRETVILVHGLWMRAFVLLPLRYWLIRRGFAVRLFSYPSIAGGLARNAEALAQFISHTSGTDLHLVGHSLGGLVILHMLARHADPRLRRAVLMGSPAAGSHCASVLARTPVLSALLGRSLKDWLAQPRPQPSAPVEIGVLAGSRSFGLGRLAPGLPRPNDGVVAVAETRLPEARDSVVLDVAHAQMLVSRACADQVAAFLRTGGFVHE
ncbi:MAG: alpha/beta fold hydrolase [Sulfuricella sp.]|nr:alpha/beta fold hydrolase [Sulfuricella sp.]